MKYLGLLLAAAGLYLYFSKQAPVAEVQDTITGTEVAAMTTTQPGATPARTNNLKRPIDRTKDVLGKVKARNGDGEF